MNESVIRSPKWLRKFVDFEVNTKEDIKGTLSKKKERELENERKLKEEDELRKKLEEQAENKRKKLEEKLREEKFNNHIDNIIKYIFKNYKDCEISTYGKKILIIEKHNLQINNINFEFIIELNNSFTLPTFEIYIKHGSDIYDYNVSGFEFKDFKNFLVNTVYQWYKNGESYEYNQSSKKTNNKSESEEIKNKRRRYNLLKDTLDGYERNYKKILDWEKYNYGDKHDERDTIENEIKNIKDKIKNMKSEFKFEGKINLNHLKRFNS